jgi:hypothetical protein
LTELGGRIVKSPVSDIIKWELPLFGLTALVSLCWALAIDGGFQGWDDLHYYQAAQNWLHNGPSLPTDHWSGRLPYVLLLAASIMLFGANTVALVIPNSILFLIVIGTSWWIAKLQYGVRSGVFAAILTAATPLFFRFPQTFYPEALETALFGLEIVLVIIAIRSPTDRIGTAILLGAGLIGGTALVLRATSAVVPVAIALYILLEVGRRRPGSAFIFICSLAAGYIVPLLAEGLYYYLLTGEPFYRYMVDGKDGVVNDEMIGETIIGRDALLNLRLAALWGSWAPSVFKVHWTVNHLINLFTTPSLLLTPYFGLAGLIYGLRSEKMVNFALFAIFMLGLQYILYTFVFVLSPTPRYYATSVLLFCVFGGLFLSKLSSAILWSGLLSVHVVIAVMVGLTQISPQAVVKALVINSQGVSPIYISSPTADAAYLAFERDRRLAETVRVGFPPIGGVALIGWDGWASGTLNQKCDDGTPKWNVMETTANPSILWRVINDIYPKAAAVLPDRIASYIRRDVENAALARRRC